MALRNWSSSKLWSAPRRRRVELWILSAHLRHPSLSHRLRSTEGSREDLGVWCQNKPATSFRIQREAEVSIKAGVLGKESRRAQSCWTPTRVAEILVWRFQPDAVTLLANSISSNIHPIRTRMISLEFWRLGLSNHVKIFANYYVRNFSALGSSVFGQFPSTTAEFWCDVSNQMLWRYWPIPSPPIFIQSGRGWYLWNAGD